MQPFYSLIRDGLDHHQVYDYQRKNPEWLSFNSPLLKKIQSLCFYFFSFLGRPVRQKIFMNEIRTINYEKEELNLPHIYVKGRKQTFNHLIEFKIFQKKLWYRISGTHYWERIVIEDLPKTSYPVAVLADGANLVVINHLREVHYRKVLQEKRTDSLYKCASKIQKEGTWKVYWFTMPILRFFAKKQRLKIPENIRACTISHRGQLTHYFKDGANKIHADPVGVTTLFFLSSDGKKIILEDCWFPPHLNLCIPVPEKSHVSYEALNLSSSASTILLIGYQYATQQDGSAIRSPRLYSAHMDIDILGWNPFKPYTYFPEESSGDAMYLPSFNYQNHSLPKITDKGEISSKITILQTGEGNDNKEIRISGKNNKGKPGFYFKKITCEKWGFFADPSAIQEDYHPMSLQEIPVLNYPKSKVSNWKGFLKGYPVELSHFGASTVKASLALTLPNQTIKFLLYRRENLIFRAITGSPFYHYDLVLPEKETIPQEIKQLFGDKKIISLSITSFLGHHLIVSIRGWVRNQHLLTLIKIY